MSGIGRWGTGKHNFGYVPDPPEPEECSPENFGDDFCKFCLSYDYCKAEYEANVEVDDDNT